MSVACLTVPPMPVLELTRRKPRGSRKRSHPRIFPRALEDELERIARDAVRAGIDPVIGAPANLSEARARSLLDSSFRAFLKERSRVWPPVIQHMKENWLVLFPLLREVAGLIRLERTRVPIPDVDDGSTQARSLMRFGLALRTYELTLQITLRSMPRIFVELATGKPPKGLEDSKSVLELLNRIDIATAALEFGTLSAIRMIERPDCMTSRVFEGATEYAARGADEQHQLLRGVIRSILGEERAMVGEGDALDDPGIEVPPEAVLADWIKAVLAA